MIIKNILVAEDIRQELGNKLSLMGIVGDTINIEITPEAPKDMPIPIILSSLITIENDRAEPINGFVLEVTMSIGEQQIAKMGAKIGPDGNPRFLHLPVPRFEFAATESVILTIDAKILKDNDLMSESSSSLNVNINRS